MNVFHFGDDDAKESAEEKPVTQKSSYNENITGNEERQVKT